MKTLSCCPICYRGSEGIKSSYGEASGSLKNEIFKEGKVDKRFFRLFQRYLNGGKGEVPVGDNELRLFPLEELSDLGIFGCGECSKLMEGFCDLYHQLKTIELKINWRVQTVKSVMKGGQRVPARVKCVREFIGRAKEWMGLSRWGSGNELFKTVTKSRKALIDKSSLKLRNTFPKLSMEKWKVSNGISLTEASHPPERCNGAGPITGTDKSEGRPSNVDVEGRDSLAKRVTSIVKVHSCRSPAIGDNTIDKPLRPSSKSQVRMNEEDAGDHTTEKSSSTLANVLSKEIVKDIRQDPEIDAEPVQDDINPVPLAHPPKSDLHMGNVPAHSSKMECVEGAAESISEEEMEMDLPQHNSDFESDFERPLETPPKDKLIACDWEAENATTTDQEKMSRLRSTHICSHCRKTFSSEARLQLHVQEAHKDDEEGDAPMESDNEDGVVNDGDDQDMCWTSSSSEDEYEISLDKDADNQQTPLLEVDPLETPVELPEPSSDQRSSDQKPIVKREESSPTYKHKSRPRKRKIKRKNRSGQLWKKNANALRWKCPTCGAMFADAAALLLHRNAPDCPCMGSSDLATTLRVEVFARPQEDDYYHAAVDESKFTVPLALVDLPQEVFACDLTDCGGLAFYSAKELDAHKKLHGEFQCKLCKVKKSYAPDLSIHENLKHVNLKHPAEERKIKSHLNYYNCVRCEFRFSSNGRDRYIRHHLSCHLNLTYNEPTCTICKSAGKLPKSKLKEHLRIHHDLTNVSNPDEIIRCDVKHCKAYFLTKSQLKEHHRLCHSDLNTRTNFRLKCPDCNDMFPSVNDFLFHRKESESCPSRPSYDPATSVRVDVMGLELSPNNKDANVEGSSFTHRLATIDLPQEVCQCQLCDMVLYSSEDLEAHQKLHGQFQCKFCPVKKCYAPEIARHELKHYKGKLERDKRGTQSTIHCPRCDFKQIYGGAGTHMYIHHHLEKHLALTFNEPKCPICKGISPNKEYDFQSNPVEHFSVSHDVSKLSNPEEDLFRCEEENCRAYFLNKSLLLNHQEFRHKKDRERKWQCKDCGKKLASAQGYRRHRLIHHVDPDKAIPCVFESCKNVFADKEELANHIMLTLDRANHKPHNEVDPPKEINCPTCEAGFGGKEPGLLWEHMRDKHLPPGRKKSIHICELCGKVFKQKSLLDQHYLSHSGPESWAYLCSVCSKKCLNNAKLREHMRTHTKDKLFVCQVCGQAYAHRHNLRIHVNNRHGDQVQDIPKKKSKTNFTSRKGIKRKKIEREQDDSGENSTEELDANDEIRGTKRPDLARKRRTIKRK